MKIILCILLLLINSGCATITAAETANSYTCADACINYKKCKGKSDLDKYNCMDACGFAKTAGIVSQKQLDCIARKTTCKDIFACVGYTYKESKKGK